METALYLPVKKFLEARGFRVKGEICGCDLVALPAEVDDSPPIVVIGCWQDHCEAIARYRTEDYFLQDAFAVVFLVLCLCVSKVALDTVDDSAERFGLLAARRFASDGSLRPVKRLLPGGQFVT